MTASDTAATEAILPLEESLSGTPAAPSPAARPARSRGGRFGLLLLWLLTLAALALTVVLWQKVTAMQGQLARQSAEATSRSVEARSLAQQASDEVQSAAGKLAALEGRIGDLSAYRTQVEALVQTVMRARDENLAVDLEVTLRLAQDQAQLTGSAQPLLAALRTADRRLARGHDPRLTPVAQAVIRDLERIKDTRVADTAGLLAHIDQLLREVEDLPMIEIDNTPPVTTAVDAAGEQADGWWRRMTHAVASWLRGLLAVDIADTAFPDLATLSADRAFFVRESLKLRLQSARLAILARQFDAARTDLTSAATALGAWFDPSARRTQDASALLQRVRSESHETRLPAITETLTALGAAISAIEAP